MTYDHFTCYHHLTAASAGTACFVLILVIMLYWLLVEMVSIDASISFLPPQAHGMPLITLHKVPQSMLNSSNVLGTPQRTLMYPATMLFWLCLCYIAFVFRCWDILVAWGASFFWICWYWQFALKGCSHMTEEVWNSALADQHAQLGRSINRHHKTVSKLHPSSE